MSRIWDESPYDGARLLIHLAMADHANEEGRFFVAQPSLAKKARCSVEYVRLSVQKMIDDGVLVIERKGSSRGKATEYRLLPNTIGESQKAEANPPTLTPQPPNSEALTPQLHSVTTVLYNHPDTTMEADGKAAAREWWESLPIKPIGRNAWWSLVKVCEAAAERGYTQEQIISALRQIGGVPSISQMDRQLRNVKPMSARQQRLARGLDIATSPMEIAQ